MDRINRAHPIVLDTTFILPAFGVEIEIDSTESVQEKIREVRESQETPILISDLSPLESFLKAFRLAEKAKSEEGKKAAKTGFLAVTADTSTFRCISHSSPDIVRAAFEIRMTHNDPFDCFIFATAKVFGATLVTEDSNAIRYLGVEKVESWKNFKKTLSSKKGKFGTV